VLRSYQHINEIHYVHEKGYVSHVDIIENLLSTSRPIFSEVLKIIFVLPILTLVLTNSGEICHYVQILKNFTPPNPDV